MTSGEKKWAAGQIARWAKLDGIDRCFPARWSKTRRRIYAMAPGEKIHFPAREYFNAKTSVERLNALLGERWRIETRRARPGTARTHNGVLATVTRIL